MASIEGAWVLRISNKIGEVVTEEKWLGLTKVLCGVMDTVLVVGGDWGEWSNVY